MTVQLVALVLDAREPKALAGFWAQALRWDVDGDGTDLAPTDATRFRLELRPTSEAKAGKNPIHLDLTTTSLDDQSTTVAGLVAAGARTIDIGPGHDHVVLADPEGNELCIIEPTNRFLSSCPRLGAVNGDGTRALGVFFAAALGWPLVWDQDEETAVQSPDGTGPKLTWSGPPLLPKSARERFHLHVAPSPGATVEAAVADLVALGATPVVDGRGHGCPGAVAVRDVDGNELCVVAS